MPSWQWLLLGLGVALVVYTALVLGLIVAGRRCDARALATFVPDCLVLFQGLSAGPTRPDRAQAAHRGPGRLRRHAVRPHPRLHPGRRTTRRRDHRRARPAVRPPRGRVHNSCTSIGADRNARWTSSWASPSELRRSVTLKKLVLGETWLLPAGLARTIGVAARPPPARCRMAGRRGLRAAGGCRRDARRRRGGQRAAALSDEGPARRGALAHDMPSSGQGAT